MRKKLKLGIAAGALVIATATPALAEIENAGGGTWDHGVTSSKVWSDYIHGSKCHGSTSVGTFTDRSPDTARGRWSRTAAGSRDLETDKAYWRHC